MKRFLAGFLLFLSGVALAKEPPPSTLHISDLSSGMYSYQSPDKIPDNAAVLIRNFYTDVQGMAVERNGFVGMDSSLGGGAVPVRGLWQFVDTSGNEWIIEYASRTYYKHTYNQTASSFGFTTTTNNVPRAAINLGKIMFVDGLDPAWTFDGTTSTTVASAPIGTLIVPWRTRFVIGGITNAQSTLRFSGDGDSTSWTLGGNPTDPFSVLIGGANDGYPVKCLGIYQDYLIAQKKYQTWAAAGFDQSDIVLRNVSPSIGCIDPGSNREFDNSYLFLSARGVESMTGTQITRISDPVRDISDSIVKNTSNQRTGTLNTTADWNAGSFSSLNYVDTYTVTNYLRMMYPDTFDTLRTSGVNLWDGYRTTGTTGDVTNLNNQLNLNNNADGGAGFPQVCLVQDVIYPINAFQQGTTYHFQINTPMGVDPSDRNVFEFFISSSSRPGATGDNVANFNNYWRFRFAFETADTVKFLSYTAFPGFSVAISSTVSLPVNVDIFLATATYSINMNSILVSSGSHAWTNAPTYTYLCNFNQTSGPSTVVIDNFDIAPQTFTFTSNGINVGSSISSWANMDNDDIQGSITYQTQSNSANTFAGAWTNTTNHSIPTIATNTWVAVRALFNKTTVGTTVPTVQDINVNWLEGTYPPDASIVYDGRYWLSYTDQVTASPKNNKVLVYQRNHTWTTLDIQAASYALWRDGLYFGTSGATSTDQVCHFDIGNMDTATGGAGGTSINSAINFKSYDMGAFNQNKDFRQAWLSFLGNSGYSGTFALNYLTNQETSNTTNSKTLASMSMSDGTGQVLEKLPFLSDGTQILEGREIRFQLVKNGTGDRLKLFDIALDYNLKEPR